MQIGDSTMEFVNLNKRQDWLCRMITGQGTYQRPLARVKLIETLQGKIKRALKCDSADGDADSCEEDGLEAKDGIDDPMNQLSFEEHTQSPEVSKAKPKQSARKHKKNVILRLTLPEEPPEKNSKSKETREVTLWLTNRQAVWLGVEHIPWAIRVMHEQYLLGGVCNVEPDDDMQECSPVKSRDVRWDFNAGCWVATVKTGSTVKERRLKPSNLDQAEASLVKDGCNLASMGYEDIKSTAFQVISTWVENQSS